MKIQNDYTDLKIYMEQDGLNLSMYQKKYQPLGRWKYQLSMNNLLLILSRSNAI
jgi:hypothetical protein